MICAVAVIAAFVGLALYLDPIGLSRLKPISDDECNAQQIKNNIDRYQQYSTNSFAGGEGIASWPNPNSREPSEQQHGEEWTKADYYACRLTIYTRQLVIVTTILAVATVVLIVTGVYQGRHLDRAANAAKESADALPTLERAYIFLQINPNVADWIRGIVESELFFR